MPSTESARIRTLGVNGKRFVAVDLSSQPIPQSLYPLFHKQHHKFTAPVGLASTYCTMTDHLCSNLLPNMLGIVLVRHHWS
jgi:hypothetical protein